jgi:xylose isomerase
LKKFKFSAGPWNVNEGADAFGPEVRESIGLKEKISKFKEIGIDAVMFHDDDAVPNINELDEHGIIEAARQVKTVLDNNGLAAEFVAPRLWMDSHTIDGGFTSNNKEDRDFAVWRSLRSVDIAKELGCNKIVLWLAREGTLCSESKDPVSGINGIASAIDIILDYDPGIKVLVEPKPNEPIDRSFIPTMGHVMALSFKTKDPSRVGGLVESAHAVLAGIDPAVEMAFALSYGKLWGVHLNDQNGMKFDQDKSFAAENIRQAFNQILVLRQHNYGANGEYIGLDVKAMRTQKVEDSYQHLINSIRMVQLLDWKVEQFDFAFRDKCIKERNYEALELYVLELLLSK